MGRVARAKTGLYHGGGNIPIGYDYSDGKLTINPYEAEQVRKIFDRISLLCLLQCGDPDIKSCTSHSGIPSSR